MSYLEKTLGTSEKLLFRGGIHPIFKFRIWAILFIALAAIAWLVAAEGFPWPYALGSALCVIYFCLRGILPVWTLEIGLTDCRLILKRGLIAYRTHELELKTVEEVNVSQSWFGRLFDYGTVRVHGIGVDTLVMRWIEKPLEFRKAIETAIRNLSNDRSAAFPAVAAR